MTIRLLVTMRDMAAAAHLAEVIKAAFVDPRFDVAICAQNPAGRYLSQMGIDHQKIDLPAAKQPGTREYDDLLSCAQALLNAHRPNVVLCGLSTPMDGGLDEAILACADIPTFLLQDFWGEQNLFFGKGAGTAFVLDQLAADRNMQRFNLSSIISGSARHSALQQIDTLKKREDIRSSLNIKDKQHLLGFFGQALGHMPGYWRTVSAFIDAARALGPEVLVCVRPHPRESDADRARTFQYFNDAGLSFLQMNTDEPIEQTLAAFDIVCSLFSNCTLDAAYLNWFSSKPLSVPVSMLFDPEIASYCRERVNFETLPIHTYGLVQTVYDQALLAGTLKTALLPETREKVWSQSRKMLPDPTHACKIILDHLASAV